MDVKQCIQEFTGTALLLYVINHAPHNPMVWGVGFAVLTFMTGAAMNPTVSLARIVRDPSTAAQNGANIGAQLVGAIVGGFLFLLNSAFEDDTMLAMASTGSAKTSQAILTEILISFVLVTIVFHSGKADGHFAELFCGMGYFLAFTMNHTHLYNPAAAFGGSLVNVFHGNSTGVWTDHWIFWVGPIVGAVIAAIYDKVTNPDDAAEEESTPVPSKEIELASPA